MIIKSFLWLSYSYIYMAICVMLILFIRPKLLWDLLWDSIAQCYHISFQILLPVLENVEKRKWLP